MKNLLLTGKTFVVTGASSGIGRATAKLISFLEGKVVCIGRSLEALDATRSELVGDGHYSKQCDISNTDDIPKLIKEIVSEVGLLSGIVHSAGMHFLKPLRVQDLNSVRQIMEINLIAGLALAKAFRQRGVNDQGGSLVYLSSVVGSVGQPGAVAYGASKGAVESMVRSLSLELAAENIRVNAVAPAVVMTDMTSRLRDSMPEENWKAVEKMHPLGLGNPEDIAYSIAFLLSDYARWITGSTLTVDGGYLAQ
jgi:NAD(P)-dependent dehydrogenase (short-subunit alcohol dehydrogenase family)